MHLFWSIFADRAAMPPIWRFGWGRARAHRCVCCAVGAGRGRCWAERHYFTHWDVPGRWRRGVLAHRFIGPGPSEVEGRRLAGLYVVLAILFGSWRPCPCGDKIRR